MKIHSAKPCLDADDRQALNQAFDSGQIADGDEIALFEADLAAAIRVPDAVAVGSGFAALHLALKALDVGAGDEVIIPCVSTCPAMRNAVWAAGGTPVYADVNRGDFNLSIAAVCTAVTQRTKAIIAPHHTGIPADIPGLSGLGIPVIEDCAQAIGATWQGRPVGSLGTASVFSFYATKLITSIDGGAVASGNPEFAARVRELRYYRHRHDQQMRFNYKMQNLNAALGRSQLNKLPELNERRRSTALQLLRVVAAVGGTAISSLHRPDGGGIYFKLALVLPPMACSRLLSELQKRGVPCSTEFVWMAEENKSFSNADHLMSRIITLPVYPALTDAEVSYMASQLRQALATIGNIDFGET